MSHEHQGDTSSYKHTPREGLCGISRRGLLRAATGAAFGHLLGTVTGGNMEGSSSFLGPPEALSAGKNEITIIPVALSSKDVEKRGESVLTKEKIEEHLGRDAIALCQSTSGAILLAFPDLMNKSVDPEGRHEGSQERHYTYDQLSEMADMELSGTLITGDTPTAVVFVDNNPHSELYLPGAVGIANQESRLPMAIVSARCIGAFLHELGHLLNPNKGHFGEGLGHQPVFTVERWYSDEHGVNTLHMEAGTIQELVARGCKLAGNSNPYESMLTVMAQRPSPNDAGEYKPGPLFSPPELAFLDPKNRKVMTIPSTPGRYELSYAPEKLFGVEFELSKGHALRKVIPDADKIFFGPVIDIGERSRVSEEESLGGGCDCTPFDSANYTRKVVAFTRSRDGRSTVALEIGILPNENGEKVLYADEELDIVVVTGPDAYKGPLSVQAEMLSTPAEYVKVIQLSSPEGQQVLDEARQVVARRNEVLATKSENN